MSTKIEQINAAFKDARLARDTVRVETIKLLLGEIQRLDKKSIDDSKIDTVIYNMLANIEDTLKYVSDELKVKQLEAEREVLKSFASPEITLADVKNILSGGQYDKREAMQLIKTYCLDNKLKFNGNIVNQALQG